MVLKPKLGLTLKTMGFTFVLLNSLSQSVFVFALAPSITTAPLSSSPTPGCPGNQVVLENGAGCGCPPGMEKGGDDNCTCPEGFILEAAAGCKGGNGLNQRQSQRLVTEK